MHEERPHLALAAGQSHAVEGVARHAIGAARGPYAGAITALLDIPAGEHHRARPAPRMVVQAVGVAANEAVDLHPDAAEERRDVIPLDVGLVAADHLHRQPRREPEEEAADHLSSRIRSIMLNI